MAYYHVSVPAGTYDVKFSRSGYETLTDSAVVVSAPSTTLDATLTALPKLTGQVTKAGAIPLAHVKVEVLERLDRGGSDQDRLEGQLPASPSPAGTYDVKFSRPGYETLTDSAVVVSAPSTTLDATLTALPKLTGQVTKAGSIPLAHVKVEVLERLDRGGSDQDRLERQIPRLRPRRDL